MENSHFSAQRSHKIPKQVIIYIYIFFLPAWLPCPYLDLGSLEQVRDLPAPTREGYEGLFPHCLSSAPYHLRSCDSQFLASRPVSFLKKKLYPLGFSKKSKPFINVVMERKNIPLGSEMNLQSYYFAAMTLANPFFTLSPTHPFSECTDRISLNFEFF